MRTSGTTLSAVCAALSPSQSSRGPVAKVVVGSGLEVSMISSPARTCPPLIRQQVTTQVSQQASRMDCYPSVKYLMILVGPGVSQHAIPERSVHAGTSGSGLLARDKSPCPKQVPMGRPRIAHDPSILPEVVLLVNCLPWLLPMQETPTTE